MQKPNETASQLFNSVADPGVLSLAEQARKEARLRRRKEWKEANGKPTPNTLPEVQKQKH